MAVFLTGNALNSAVEDLFENAEVGLILISPFIKLHERYTSVLKSKQNNPSLSIKVVFGKNEDNYEKSMQLQDLKFFMDFPNIEIRFEKRLHAKYYANESYSIITSMNLLSFSQNNNIEAGIMTKTRELGGLIGDSIDQQAYDYFDRVINQSDLLFKKVPKYEGGLLGIGQRYKESVVEVDITKAHFSKLGALPHSSAKPAYSTAKKPEGYCIRTRERIPLNIDRPLSDDAFRSWSAFKNRDYPEKYCHFSGEESHGETSFAKPILAKNWRKAQGK
ncbi:hypothetical protein GWC95_15655 [Sediminibacterium roseum]|uniref:Phospholipase D-like domain-containing protein n=1 Tax=Sediminibacterium roseum TaxID=1978412 RepID=A0ABW9ZYP7_9BACT|nr:hypothetical protein [Sediminibacterium roseum]NCI51364.1 hypothetical protein [Sediminibacterium roseum]